MVYFFISLLLFLFVLLYFAVSLAIILKYRTRAEEREYALKKTYICRYDFIYWAVRGCNHTDELLRAREEAMRQRTILEIANANKRLDALISGMKLSEDDARYLGVLNKDILKEIENYNHSAQTFNKRVFSLFLRPIAKMCKVKPLEML